MGALLLTAGCAAFPSLATQPNVASPKTEEGGTPAPEPGEPERQRPRIEAVRPPSPPPSERSALERAADVTPTKIEASAEDIARLAGEEVIDAALPPQALPEFIDTVFGVLLEVPYSLGPGVAERKEIVSLRTARQMSKRSFFALAQTALKDYGLVIAVEDDTVRVLQSDTLARQAPLFIRSRATPDTPAGSRPVIQFFEMKSVSVTSVVDILEDAFPDADKVKFTPRQETNTLVIAGNLSDVAQAASVIAQIDQPRFADGQVARIQPVFWKAADLASTLVQILNSEGYQAILSNATAQRAVNVLALPFINQVLIFSNQPDAYGRALYWVNQLDQPSALGDEVQTFIYVARNRDAAELAQVFTQANQGAAQLNEPLGAGQPGPGQPGVFVQPPGQGAPAGGPAGGLASTGGRITVDAGGNRILFQGTPSQFQRARDLMAALDTAPSQVLIEVTIAEVTLTDDTDLGVEWKLRQAVGNGVATFGTLGGIGLGGGGFNFDFNGEDLTVALNALSSNSKINVLSTPRLVARSGGSASIQVGTDIPVITSQRATDINQGGDLGTDVLQSVEYRKTGVLLTVEPIVYGDNRIDLLISQEVSGATDSVTPGIASPTITSRTIDTQISLHEGMTAVLGGLMQDNYTRSTVGVPFLKDIPLIGGVFKRTSVGGDKTELLIFVTPYIMRDDEQIERATRRYMDSLNAALELSRGTSYTLNPFGNERGQAQPATHGGSLGEGPDGR